MHDELLVKLLVAAAKIRDDGQAIADRASEVYEEVVTLTIQIHGDPSVIARTEEEMDV